MKELKGKSVQILDSELKRREQQNRAYLMKLTNENLLINYLLESGRFTGRAIPQDAHTGWETPVCQQRGHFLGHWLSAAAIRYQETGDEEIKSKAEAMIAELALCQRDNGNGWIGAIPEKYLEWIGKGKPVWAPQYNLHKLLMGLVDMHLFTGSQQALEVADHFADWFVQWSAQYSREQFDDILDVETGGMLEVWADLLQITGNEKYQVLLNRYYRARLFQPLLDGKDPLTNMHANTTIPEVLGCARAFEVTKDSKWMEIVNAYWNSAVTERGMYATGGQTAGEVWTPKMKLKKRIGDKNQEHCTVYNMMRLAEFLFRQTGDPAYMQYMEYNLYNGVMAQTYYQEYSLTGSVEKYPPTGLLTYFLPMKAGLRKDWSGETDSFFCCHGTMVQANAAFNRNIYYQDQNELFICQYFDSSMTTTINGAEVTIAQMQDHMSGSTIDSSVIAGNQTLNEVTALQENIPEYRKHVFTIHTSQPQTFSVNLRIPEWIASNASITINGSERSETTDSSAFYRISREWQDGDQIAVILPLKLRFIPLPDDETIGAFRYGPDVLAGICPQERMLFVKNGDVADEITMENEREWGSWRYFFRSTHQDPPVFLKRLRDIGYEPMQIYFQIQQI